MQLKEVYYHFGDASVPPPDHRSYTRTPVGELHVLNKESDKFETVR